MRHKKLVWLEGQTHLASPSKKRQDSQALVVCMGMKLPPFMQILLLWVADPGPHPLFWDQTENKFFWDHSPPHSPLIWRSGSATDSEWQICPYTSPWFHHLYSLNTKRNIEMQVSKFSCWLPPVFVLQVLFWSPSTVQC